MSISFIAIHSYIFKSVAPWGQNTLRGALYPTLPYYSFQVLMRRFKFHFRISWRKLETSSCWIGTWGRKTDGQLNMPDNSGKAKHLPVIPSGIGITILLGIFALPHTSSINHQAKMWDLKFRSEILKIVNLGWCLILLLQKKVPALRKQAWIKQLFYCDICFNVQLWHFRL